jgi:hypothetical protein
MLNELKTENENHKLICMLELHAMREWISNLNAIFRFSIIFLLIFSLNSLDSGGNNQNK